MSYLVDTNVISELRKGKKCNPNVGAWFTAIDDDEIFFSVLTFGELRNGIERIRRRDETSAAVLNVWLRGIIASAHDRILSVDRAVAEEWGRINVPATLPVIDGLLAATAKVHGLSVATRNTKDIGRFGVSCINPFSRD